MLWFAGSAQLSPYVCSVGPAGYNIRQQAQRSTNALKTKNQDTNGETICWEHTFSHSIKKSFFFSFCPGVPVCFSPAWGKFYKKKNDDTADDRCALCSLLGPSSTALDYISIATEVCSLLLSVKWFLMTLNIICERKPCVCAVSLWPAVVAPPYWNWKLQSVGAYYTRLSCVYCLYHFTWKFRSTTASKLTVELADLHPFHHHFLCHCALFAIDTPVALYCAGYLWGRNQTDIITVCADRSVGITTTRPITNAVSEKHLNP